ncbi:type I-B CRISPR-associated protein Cas8b1/Cst1 [Sporolactobacillus sp. THM19-2]|jgi:CRISPR-associated protein Cst1|uniref:type I-B CRISPR-associated protein Cas8b1/Cst1 n=1 Tax=Sporolactobacillus sp. THM19-2 TaxID=2511171 RepID=UPI00101FE439|nr:type I-B CRISPR-associated protein Cas8b1/Cst1 [Sporolactobacillus sp. THM19-2]RYL93717.1 type I-B CRISPR-associated protein Cas8b1/Cst1 [Sporolactobacillus sp. THM19-2]
MAKIELKTGSWLDNAGIVGIANILEYNGVPFSIKNNRLSFDISVLHDFGNFYFNFLSEKYKDFISYTRIVKKGEVLLETNLWDAKKLSELNAYMEYSKGKLTSNSYTAAYNIAADTTVDIVQLTKLLTKIHLKKKQNISEVQGNIEEKLRLIKQILDYLHKPDLKKYITAKNVMYDIIAKFWSNVSFLHRSATKKDPMVEYEQYFIEPIRQYYETTHENDKYCCFNCGKPIKKLSKPAAFDLAWMNRMGVDMNRKSSHFWNLNSSTCYICPICNFVFSCVPTGFTFLNGQGYFVNSNSELSSLIKLNVNGENMAVKSDETINLLELRTYYQIIKIMEHGKLKQSNREIENIQIIKFNQNNNVRPYSFNILSKDKLSVINKNKENLGKLLKPVKVRNDNFLNIYENIINYLYHNKNQFDLIQLMFRESIPENAAQPLRNTFSIRHLIYLNNDFIWTIRRESEGNRMTGYSSYVSKKTIDHVMKEGQKLAEVYIRKGAANKMQGITYRLLNALKSKNIGRFMDTFFNAYLYAKNSSRLETNLIIPTELSETLNDEDKLQTLGYAFILGFRSGRQLNDKGE